MSSRVKKGRLSCAIRLISRSVILSRVRLDEQSIKILALSLIFAGGFSNLLDRLIWGCVVDFIDLKIWPAFNLADAAITIGVVVLIFSLIMRKAQG